KRLTAKSKLQPRSKLEGARSSRPKYLSGARARLSVIHLIKHIVVAGDVGDIENVEDFTNERQCAAFSEVHLSSQAEILRDEAVSAGKVFRQRNRIDDLVKWRAWPGHGDRAVGVRDASCARFDAGVVFINQSSQFGTAQSPAERVVSPYAGQQGPADAVAIQVQPRQHRIEWD